MKTQSGYETDGTYLKFKSAYTQFWKVETEKDIRAFRTEAEADEWIKDNLKS